MSNEVHSGDSVDEQGYNAQHEEAVFTKKKKRVRREESGGALNINSMMDIMVIILVFLLKQYGEDPLKVQAEDLKVPSSYSQLRPEDTTTITIGQSSILVDDKKSADVKGGQVDKSQKQGGEQSLMIRQLFEDLSKTVKKKKREKKQLGQEYKPIATIIADQSIPYRLVTEVMYTAGQAELSQFKFAVIKTDRKYLAN